MPLCYCGNLLIWCHVAAQQRPRFRIRISNFKQTNTGQRAEHWNLSLDKACDQGSCFFKLLNIWDGPELFFLPLLNPSQGMADEPERLRFTAWGEIRFQKEGRDLRFLWTPATWAFPDHINWPTTHIIVRYQFGISFNPSLSFPYKAKRSPIMGRNSQFLDEDANNLIH